MTTGVSTIALDGRYYTDALIFKNELKSVLAQTWQFAGHQSQLQQAGDYFCFEIAGENLFCVLDQSRTIQCYYNVCQHRAHELLRESGNKKQIVCPYHAWTYTLDGKLRSGPNLESVPGFNKDSICLTSVRHEIFNGFIFVNLDNAAKPMDEWYPEVRTQLQEWVPDISCLQPLEWVHVEEQCNWKISVENYSECYHCQINHPTFVSGVIKPETYDIQPQGHCLRHTTECQNLDSMSYPVDINANSKAGGYSSWFLWPMFSFQVYPGNILNTYHWRPLAVDQVTLIRGWYSLDGEENTTVRQLAQQDRDTTVEEDIALIESVQRGLGSRGYKPGPLVIDPAGGVRSEHSIAHLHDWYLQHTEGKTQT